MVEVRRRSPTRGTARVPIGVEKALYLAANDPRFRTALLDDRERTVARMKLTDAERATLCAVPRAALEKMIDRLRPQHGRGRFARTVAAASVTLAASLSGAAGCDGDDDDGDAEVDVPPPDTVGDTSDPPDVWYTDVDVPPGDTAGDTADPPPDVEPDVTEEDGADVPLPPVDAGGILPDAPDDDVVDAGDGPDAPEPD